MLDKFKVQMVLQLNSAVLVPGDTVKGGLHVTVKEEVELTAIRFEMYGTEKASATLSDRQRTEVTREFLHFKKIITLTGYSVQSGKRGGLTLAPGKYSYPFEFQLPYGLPPSFFCEASSGESDLQYIARGVCVIPMGFDAKEERKLLMLQATPESYFLHTHQVPVPLKPATSKIYGMGCCGCFCCEHKGASVEVKGSVFPTMVVLPHYVKPLKKHQPPVLACAREPCAVDGEIPLALPPQPNDVAFRLVVRNTSQTDVIKVVGVRVKQVLRVEVDGHVRTRCIVIGSCGRKVPNEQLFPNETVTMDLVVHINPCPRVTNNSKHDQFPLPTLHTPYTRVSTVVEVVFPDVVVDESFACLSALEVVTAVDKTNREKAAVHEYVSSIILPEDKKGASK